MSPQIPAESAPLNEFPEVERYELSESPAYRFDLNRRECMGILGAGLLLAVNSRRGVAQQRRRGERRPDSEQLSERFHIGRDGIVTVLTSKVEVGQGSRTQLTQAAAEELRMPVNQVQLIMADTLLCPDDGGTAGSRTTPSTVPRVRSAAAIARGVLIQLVADQWKVAPESVRFEGGAFRDENGARQMSLAELAEQTDFATEWDQSSDVDVQLRPVDQWKVLGTPVKKTTGREVVTGQQRYPSDIRRDGLRYGKVLRAPRLNSQLVSIGLEAAQSLPDVQVIRNGDFVGCVAPTQWAAAKAIEALAKTAQWEVPDQVSSKDLMQHFRDTADAGGGGRNRPDVWGDSASAWDAAPTESKIDVSYEVAYIQHCPMEPRAAVAEWDDDQLTVWTGTQQPSRVQRQLAEVFHIPPEKVRVIVPDTGGGFGGKHSGEAAVEAAQLAKGAECPVQLRWTRQEEFTWAYCRPAGLIEVKAAIDRGGRLLAWDFANYNSGGSAIETPYKADNGNVRLLRTDSPLRQGSYRALASTANTFARESAMDELAALAKVDPLEFRLQHLPEGRLKDVLIAAAKKFDWQRRVKEKKSGRGIGLACGTEKGSFVACCAEVEVAGDAITILSLCQAFECGAVQNPVNLRSQVMGAMVMGLGGALTEAMRFENGKILTDMFSSYRVPRMADVPAIEIELVDRQDLPSVGAGETPIIAVAPAIGNAVFQANGTRLRSLPMKLPG